MSKKKEPSFSEWFKQLEEIIKGRPREKPNITVEEWDKMSPKEKIRFIRDRREAKK